MLKAVSKCIMIYFANQHTIRSMDANPKAKWNRLFTSILKYRKRWRLWQSSTK